MRTNSKQIVTAALILTVTSLAGYAKEDIKVYTVAKEKKHAPAAMSRGGTDGVDVNAAPVHWTTPPSWKELPPTSIRLGNFAVPGKDGKNAEVAITSFPGSVGSEVDNWNRWRNELKLPPTGASEVISDTAAVGASDAKLYDISSDTLRTVVAVLPKDGATWFFKLRGDKQTVADAKAVFIEFLKTIRFDAAPAHEHASDAPADPHAGLSAPANDPHANLSSPPSATSGETESTGLPQWNLPSNWTEKPAGMMVLKSYTVQNDKGTASVAISVFPGDVGGTFANVNRWRGQMGLAPVTEAELPKATQTIDVAGAKATLVDFNGTDAKTGKPARLVAVSVPHSDSTWFYKLIGDDAVVGVEKKAFIQFVQTVRYP